MMTTTSKITLSVVASALLLLALSATAGAFAQEEPAARTHSDHAAHSTFDLHVSGMAAPLKRAAGEALDVSMHLELEGMVAGTRGANLKVTSGEVMVGESSYDVTSGKVAIRGGKAAVSMALEGEDGKRLKVTMAGKLGGAVPAEGESADVSFSKAVVARLWKLDVTGELTNTTFFMHDEEDEEEETSAEPAA